MLNFDEEGRGNRAPTVYWKRAFEAGLRAPALKTLMPHMPEFTRGSFVGVKITVGEVNCKHFIPPELVRIVVDVIKSQGAKPFVFDTNVLYRGRRMNAIDHASLAYEKGFSPQAIGAPFLIADGMFGYDTRTLKVNYKHIKQITIPQFIGCVDNLVVISHITGHIMSGYAGAIKNVGMGMSSRAGKQVQHSSVKPRVTTKKCVLCSACIDACPVGAISEKDAKAYINPEACIGCGECVCACQCGAIAINWNTETKDFCERMAEYCAGILSKFRTTFFINCAFDITKECDCMASSNEPLISKDVGIFASQDIVAVEKATLDTISKSADVFSQVQHHTFYRDQIAYVHKLSVGSPDYTLIEA